MKTIPEKITLVTVCDNFYAILLSALLKSIEVNHTSPEKIDLYIVDDNIKRRNKERLQQTLEKDSKILIKWIKMKDVLKGTLLPKDNSSFPMNVYLRLLIPHFLPAELERVIYLDVDMIVESDISRLWHTDIKGMPIAAVQDRCETINSPWGGIRNYQELGLDGNLKYFNSGLLIFDLNQWRREEYAKKIIACVEANNKYTGFPDQYGLNVVFAGKWFELDAKWNGFATDKEATSIPDLIHFIGRKPIYQSYEHNEIYRQRFYHYLSLTPWKNFKPYRSYKFWINKTIHKLKSYDIRLKFN